jgi:uncharacterized SAM-binding protein YcdF (DUF218 family)
MTNGHTSIIYAEHIERSGIALFGKLSYFRIEETLLHKRGTNFERLEIERLCGGTPDVLSILSGSVVKRELRHDNARYSSGSYGELDVAGLLNGGKARVIATAEIARFYPNVAIIANGNTYENAPSDAQVMKEELGRFGVSTDHVLLQEKSYSTFTEFVELVKFVVRHKWRRIVIITNEFHIPRAQELLRQLDTLQDPDGVSQDADFRAALPVFHELSSELVFVSADAILPLRNPRYERIVDQAKASPEWQERAEREVQGLKQLQEGTYWSRVEKKKKPFRL